jgi:diaminobutyrate-2-oxoglutarate transaminase
VWEPCEHNGTFRGYNPAFVTGAAALRTYWADDALQRSTLAKGERVRVALSEIAAANPGAELTVKGRGLAQGLAFSGGELAGKVCAAAFERGLLVETSGPDGEVVKLLPALTITDDELTEGLRRLTEAVTAIC